MSESRPEIDTSQALPLLPLRGAVLFPGAVAGFEMGRAKSLALAEHLSKGSTPRVYVFAQRSVQTDDPSADDLHSVGVLARVVGVQKQKSGNYGITVQGLARVKLDGIESTEPYLVAKAHEIPEVGSAGDRELDALGHALKDGVREILQFLPNLPRDISAQLDAAVEPSKLADFIAMFAEATVDEKAELLAIADVKERVRRVLTLVHRSLETFKVREKISSQVKDEMGKTQREYALRQQMKAIQEELGGDGESQESELDELEKRIAEAKLSVEAADVAKKQLKRLRVMQQQSPEYAMVRTYLDWILDLPWVQVSSDPVDLAQVRATLDADHYGLEKVKKRILEFLAVRKLKSDNKGPILCLIGPPGVGKTSLAKSIAHAIDRKLHRSSLGGVRDEAAIRGHRRTYIGALPGQVIQGMKKVGTTNPVFVLDELDKLGSDLRGDPSAALLEVLDPEQNNTFADHYLEIPYDLSNVMFIATANQADTIPAPLRDRMEIIEIPGYTRNEKLAIAKKHLLPKQLAEHGLTAQDLDVTDDALRVIIERYTREAGVRSLERQIAAVARGVVVDLADGGRTQDQHLRVVSTEEDVRRLLGQPRFTSEVAERTEDAGVATGLAWTPVGGEILFIEATKMPGKGSLVLTGQLGDVMKESAQAALSYVRAGAERYGIAKNFLEGSDIHLHVPAGAMPKDGPSAGVTMLTALVSLLSGVRVRHDVAMTGEITLRGRVLPIGGLKEKVLAAHRAGIKRIVAPERNRHDLEEIPEEVRGELEFVWVSRMDEVIDAALEHTPFTTKAFERTPAAGVGLAG